VDVQALEFRPAGPGDAPRIAELVVEGFATYRAFAPPGWAEPTLEDEIAQVEQVLALQSGWCLLAEDSSARLAGHVAWHDAGDGRRAIDEAGLAHLWQLFARKDWWGSGLAARLQAAGLQAAAAQGFTTIRLQTPTDHGRGRRFYEREGWALSMQPFFDEPFGMSLVEYRRTL
jgi:GNAT superfamily N-acetyltransferase